MAIVTLIIGLIAVIALALASVLAIAIGAIAAIVFCIIGFCIDLDRLLSKVFRSLNFLTVLHGPPSIPPLMPTVGGFFAYYALAYVSARLMLIGLALVLLRHQPPSALIGPSIIPTSSNQCRK